MTPLITPEGVTVEAGQVWADNDPRSAGRKLEVVSTDKNWRGQDQVVFKTIAVARNVSEKMIGRTTRIRLARLRNNSNGYRLVEG